MCFGTENKQTVIGTLRLKLIISSHLLREKHQEKYTVKNIDRLVLVRKEKRSLGSEYNH